MTAREQGTEERRLTMGGFVIAIVAIPVVIVGLGLLKYWIRGSTDEPQPTTPVGQVTLPKPLPTFFPPPSEPSSTVR
jgi:hypothetical protein